jgi:hypothetical protein
MPEPEYNNHGDVLNRYWPRLVAELPDFQFHVVDGEDILARARAIPVRWDGTIDDLPAGIDGAIARGFDEVGASVLCALVIMVPRALQGRGVSRLAVEGLREIAARHSLHGVIAPVRPSVKERYPLTSIERYAAWTREDGLPFDPWMRVHARLSATILKPEPRSMRITGSLDEWEDWTGMLFPTRASTSSPAGSRRSASASALASTGSRMCGCTTLDSPLTRAPRTTTSSAEQARPRGASRTDPSPRTARSTRAAARSSR